MNQSGENHSIGGKKEDSLKDVYGGSQERSHRLVIKGQNPRLAMEYIREGIDKASLHTDCSITTERVDAEDDNVIYRCTECGQIEQDVGTLHAHCEKHRGLLGFQLPWRVGDYDELAQMTEALRVEEVAYCEVMADDV